MLSELNPFPNGPYSTETLSVGFQHWGLHIKYRATLNPNLQKCEGINFLLIIIWRYLYMAKEHKGSEESEDLHYSANRKKQQLLLHWYI